MLPWRKFSFSRFFSLKPAYLLPIFLSSLLSFFDMEAPVIRRTRHTSEQIAFLTEVERKPISTHLVVGGPGTGKSTMIVALVKKLGPGNVLVLAPTGTAAMIIKNKFPSGGVHVHTIHQALGIWPGKCLDRPPKVTEAWFRSTRQSVVILDEMSMVDAKLFEVMMKQLRKFFMGTGKTFGFIAFGDPLQLRPVDQSEGILLQSKLLQSMRPRCWKLTKSHRFQEKPTDDEVLPGETTFPEFVSSIRTGLTEDSFVWMRRNLVTQQEIFDGMQEHQKQFEDNAKEKSSEKTFETHVCTPVYVATKDLADEYNTEHLKSIDREEVTYQYSCELKLQPGAKEGPLVKVWFDDIKKKNIPDWLPKEKPEKTAYTWEKTEPKYLLTLKPGAQVMLTRNIYKTQSGTWTNGTFARVISCGKPSTANKKITIVVEDSNGRRLKTSVQRREVPCPHGKSGAIKAVIDPVPPFIVAAAVTYHKAQGNELKKIILDLRMARYDQFYVGTTRAQQSVQFVNLPLNYRDIGEPDESLLRWESQIRNGDPMIPYEPDDSARKRQRIE